MAAASYYAQDQHPLLSHTSPPPQYPAYAEYPPTPHHEHNQHLLTTPSSPLKPLHLVTQHASPSTLSAQRKDARLKSHIRRLRLTSRILSLLLSLGALVPVSWTLATFLATKSTYRVAPAPDGTHVLRTAWAAHSRVWPTAAYVGVGATSTALHAATLVAYVCGVAWANRVNTAAGVVEWVVNAGVWGVAAGVYRAEKDKGGRSDDLWGWTCSARARGIQDVFRGEVNFRASCAGQSAAWYVGVAQAVAGVLTVVIYGLVFLRGRSKKGVVRAQRGGKAGM